jgi:TonB family protein
MVVMTQLSTATRSAKIASPRLLVELEPWNQVFKRNFRDLFRHERQWHGSCLPGRFWPDVFVSSRLPWRALIESSFCHLIFFSLLWWVSHFAAMQPQIVKASRFQASDVVTYPASEYLPPLNTMTAPRAARGGDPKYAKQEIISVPREADNMRQTIVTPPDIKLKQDLPVPNIVSWSHTPVPVPLAATTRTAAEMRIPESYSNVVAPPPDARLAASMRNTERLPAAVIEPPPSVEGSSTRKIGDLNIGHSEVVAPAPQLPMGEQRALTTHGELSTIAPTSVVAPPPTVERGSGWRGAGELIALNAEAAAPSLPLQTPAGNRRGTFAAGPGGKATGSGVPDLQGHAGSGAGQDFGSTNNSVPSGLYVGKGSSSSAVAGTGQNGGTRGAFATPHAGLMASARPPRISATPEGNAEPVPPELTMPVDRKVFGDRKFYAMTQNMPNLNSGGGSWVIRFAELKQNEAEGQLLPPVALRKVDPAYPVELMKNNVEGTVTLYAVIHSDGHVSTVRVLDGPDDRLNSYASDALSHWQFQPAVKNGEAIAIEAVVRVPFKPRKLKSAF